MPDNCDVFRTESEKDAFREFSHWLMDGGMASLRDMQKASDDYKRLRSIGFGVICKAFWVGLLLILGVIAVKLGISDLIKK